jgi:hypothetical protein
MSASASGVERPDLDELVRRAQERWDKLVPAQRREMERLQKRSWIVCEAGFASDEDEAAFKAALDAGDWETVARLTAASRERMRLAGERFDQEYPPYV